MVSVKREAKNVNRGRKPDYKVIAKAIYLSALVPPLAAYIAFNRHHPQANFYVFLAMMMSPVYLLTGAWFTKTRAD